MRRDRPKEPAPANRPASIRKNYLYNTLYQILTVVTPLVTAPYASRVLGADKIGIQSYTNSIVAYFVLFATLGTTNYGQREIAMHRDDPQECSKIFWEIELLSVLTTLAATAVWVLWILMTDTYTVYYMALTMTLVTVAFNISWFYAGLELFKYNVMRNVMVKILGIIMLFTLIHSPDDLLLYMALGSAIHLLGTISMWTYLPGLLRPVDRHHLKIGRHLKQTLVYFVPAVATSVYTVLDKTMIGMITKSEEINGYYEQASKIIKVVESLLLSLNTVMTTRMSYLFAEKRLDELKSRLLRSYDYLLLLAVPATFGLIGIAPNFVPWFFGNGYLPVIPLLRLLAVLPLVICISNILGTQYLTPSGQRFRSGKAIFAGAFVNFCLNSILIRTNGAEGAAVASIAAECTVAVIYVHMSKGYITWGQIIERLWKRVAAGAVMLLAVLAIGCGRPAAIIVTLVQVAAGAAVYALVLLLLRDRYLIELIGEVRKGIRHDRHH